MTSAIGSTRIVLQGEFSAVKDDDAVIKTTIPNTCTIFTLYNKESKIRVLAHIDDYTDVDKAIIHISGILENRFNKPISPSFVAKVFGGTNDSFSKKQQKLVIKAFEKMKINFDVLLLSQDIAQRSQSVFKVDGKVSFLEKKEINNRLEYLQVREYGEWNNYLDRNYGDLQGDQIPYFEIKEASRLEKDIPYFEIEGLQRENIKKAQLLEREGKLQLPIQEERTAVQDNKEVIRKLQELINKSSSNLIKKTAGKQNFNLLLRQSVTHPAHMQLSKFLLTNKLVLNINIESQGEKSGTAMDVAKKFNNQKAVDLLKMYQS
ncbi:MAG: hypothetical protein ACRCU0_07455 [Candidatus Rhabdochlamydia sp.]